MYEKYKIYNLKINFGAFGRIEEVSKSSHLQICLTRFRLTQFTIPLRKGQRINTLKIQKLLKDQ